MVKTLSIEILELPDDNDVDFTTMDYKYKKEYAGKLVVNKSKNQYAFVSLDRENLWWIPDWVYDLLFENEKNT